MRIEHGVGATAAAAQTSRAHMRTMSCGTAALSISGIGRTARLRTTSRQRGNRLRGNSQAEHNRGEDSKGEDRLRGNSQAEHNKYSRDSKLE